MRNITCAHACKKRLLAMLWLENDNTHHRRPASPAASHFARGMARFFLHASLPRCSRGCLSSRISSESRLPPIFRSLFDPHSRRLIWITRCILHQRAVNVSLHTIICCRLSSSIYSSTTQSTTIASSLQEGKKDTPSHRKIEPRAARRSAWPRMISASHPRQQ